MRRTLWAMLASGPLAAVVLIGARQVPTLVEHAYAPTLSPNLLWPLSRLTGLVPIPVGELTVAGLVALAIWLVARSARARCGQPRMTRFVLGRLALVAGAITSTMIAITVGFWGLNAARPPLATRLDLVPGEQASSAELGQLTEELVLGAEAAYLRIHGRVDAGVPTTLPLDDSALRAALDSGWRVVAAHFAMPAYVHRSYGRPKFTLLNARFEWSGVLGQFMPFTGEAVLARGLPAVQYVKTLAHEQAHQRGEVGEGDANLLAILVCLAAPDPLANYAGLVFARDQFMVALAAADRERMLGLWRSLGPGTSRDVDDLYDGLRRRAAKRASWAPVIHDLSLKASGMPDGRANYGRSTGLLIEYARRTRVDSTRSWFTLPSS